MVKEIVVLRETGIPLFHYSVDEKEKLDVVVAAFLSAIGSMAEQTGDHQIKTISFSESKFVWESKGDLFFIALVALDDSAGIYRVIMQELAEQFVSSFYSELRKEDPSHKVFRAFTDTVEATLQKFDGIPGLARKYKTGLLPPSELKRLKLALAETETRDLILRGAVITSDEYIVSSNLRSYELEAILDLMPSVAREMKTSSEPLMVVHTSLDPVTSFLIQKFGNVGIGVFVVKAGRENSEYLALIAPFMDVLSSTDFRNMRKFKPDRRTESTGFYDFDTVVPNMSVTEALDGSRSIFSGVSKPLQASSVSVLKAIDGNATFVDLMTKTSMSREELNEALALLIAKGVARVAQLFPVMGLRDERFSAYLEVVGMPKRDYDVIDAVWSHCTGGFSLREISGKTGIPASRIIEVLRSLKRYVVWETERVLAQIR